MLRVKLYTNGIGGMLPALNNFKRIYGSSAVVEFMYGGVIKALVYPTYKAKEDVSYNKTHIAKDSLLSGHLYEKLNSDQQELFVCVGYVNPETHVKVEPGQLNNEKIMSSKLDAIVL